MPTTRRSRKEPSAKRMQTQTSIPLSIVNSGKFARRCLARSDHFVCFSFACLCWCSQTECKFQVPPGGNPHGTPHVCERPGVKAPRAEILAPAGSRSSAPCASSPDYASTSDPTLCIPKYRGPQMHRFLTLAGSVFGVCGGREN